MSREELKLTVAQIETTEQEDAQRDGGAVFLDDDVEDGATDQEAAYRMTGEDDNVQVTWQYKLELTRMELDAQRMELERERQAEERKIKLARIEADKEVRIAELRAQNGGNVEGPRSGPTVHKCWWERSYSA